MDKQTRLSKNVTNVMLFNFFKKSSVPVTRATHSILFNFQGWDGNDLPVIKTSVKAVEVSNQVFPTAQEGKVLFSFIVTFQLFEEKVTKMIYSD